MADQKVAHNPRTNEGAVDLSNSSISRATLSLTAAALTLTASDKALAAREYAPTHSTEPTKAQIFLETPKVAFYQVNKGDNLSEIAKRFKVPQKDIRAANPGLDPDKLRIGQSLKLPNVTKGFHIITEGQNPSKIAGLYKIPVKDLMDANPGINPNNLKIGQALALPARSGTPTQAPAQAPQPTTPQHTTSPTAPAQPTPHYKMQASAPAPVMEASIFSPSATAGMFASMVKLLGFEGGISRSSHDAAHKNGVPVTNLGITGMAMKDFIRKTENRDASNAELVSRIENLTTEEAIKIYASGYWRKEFQPLGSKLSFLMFDWGVTSHPTTVTKQFQERLGVPVTGRVDDATVNAVKALGESRACEAFTDCRKEFYTRLAERRPSDQKNLPGWLARSDEAANFVHSSRFERLVNVFEQTAPRGCDLFDPVRLGTVTVRKGAQEPTMVRVLQERLTRAGWTVAVDGKFGPEMERVIGNFKQHFGLPGKAEWGKTETTVLDAILMQSSGSVTGLPPQGKQIASR